MGQKTNPIGNRLDLSEDGSQTGMVAIILVKNYLKMLRLENILR